MKNDTKTNCTQCGATLPPDAPRGMCPACLVGMALTPGERIQYFGNYELLTELGAGGMGVVWKARQASLNRYVALKMLRGAMFAQPEEVARFRTEAEAAANLQHANIVAIHEIGEFGGQHFYTMDFVEGKNLAEVCDGKPMPARQAAELLAVIADAVQFAHQRGILHRDLKPQNVMLDEEGRPRLTDFGLAKRLDADSALTQTGAVVGSPSYMAPEQALARTDRVGTHTDVYALGAVLYEMLTGRAPFRAETAAETMMRVITVEPAAPSKLNADVPRDLETICLKCLEKDPSRRYATARELAEDVRRFLAGVPVVARPVGTVRKITNWMRRRATTVAGFAAVLVFALAAYAYYLAQENAFLLAKAQNPGLQKQFGANGRALVAWNGAYALFMMGIVWLGLWFSRTARRITWHEIWQPGRQFIPMQPVGAKVRNVCIAAGVLGLALSLGYLDVLIKWQVWEGASKATAARPGPGVLSYYCILFSSLWMSAGLLMLCWRDHQLTAYGRPIRRLDPAVETQIRAALEDRDFILAIRHYRQAVPDAGLAEARDHALRIAAELRAKDPAKFEDGFDAPRATNWRLTLITAAIGIAVSVGLWFLVRPEHPGPTLYSAGCGLVFIGTLMFTSRMKGFARRILPIMLVMIAFQVGGLIFFEDKRANDHILDFVFGVGFGIALMLSARTRRRA